jgi:hypothetical protein
MTKANLTITLDGIAPAAHSMEITLAEEPSLKEYKVSTVIKANTFTLKDIERDPDNKRYFVTIDVFGKKGDLVDRLFIATSLPEEETLLHVNGLSGRWEFEKPLSFNMLSGDPTSYDSMLITPTEEALYDISHYYCLFNKAKQVASEKGVISYSIVDRGRMSIRPHSSIPTKSGSALCFNLDRREIPSSAGVLKDKCHPEQIDALLSKPCVFSSGNKLQLKVCEFTKKNKYTKEIPDEKKTVETEIDSAEKILTGGQAHTGNATGSPVMAKGLSTISFYKTCFQSYKVFPLQYADTLEITIDTGDLYIYPMTIKREGRS